MIDTVIGKYRIVGQLGRGGTGIVYKAIDETLGRDVAIKILNPDLADSEIIKRFQVEATALAKLNHPGIATIHELFRSENDLLMVMELVRGETLEKLAERLGPLDPQRAVYIVDQLLLALAHAHRAGIVHRDIKPTNVMVTTEGVVKIMDFGVARVRDAEHTTSRGKLVGTPAYMPPEQVLGEKTDERSDVYAVGVVLYRLLSGALPFASDSSIGMLQRHVSETPIPMRSHREGVPEWCETIVARAMAKSPDDRFQSADEFREALGHASGLLPSVDVAKALAVPNGHAADASGTKPDTVVIPRGEVNTTRPKARVGWNRRRFMAGASKLGLGRRHFVVGASTLAVAIVGLLILAYTGLPRRSPAVTTTKPQPTTAKPAAANVPAPQPATIAVSPKPASVPQPPASTPAAPTPAAPPPTQVAATTPAASEAPAPSAANPASSTSTPATPSTSRDATQQFPVLVFDAKALVPEGDKEQERDAQLVLAAELAVTPNDTRRPLYSVGYSEVVAVYYSRGRDPMWKSPRGAEPAARTGGGFFRKLGVSQERHWITIRTGPDRFIILRLKDTLVKNVLTALQKRTGRKPFLFSDVPPAQG